MKILLNKIRKILNKPFPFYESYKQKIGVPIALSLIVMIGIILLNPSENLDSFIEQVLNVFTYGFITIFITLVFSLVLPEILPNTFDIEKWNVKKTIIFFLLSVLSVGIFISLFAYHFDNLNSISFFPFFFVILIRAIVLSFFPIIALVLFAESWLHKRNHIQAVGIINKLKKSTATRSNQPNDIAYTFAKNTKDEINVYENDLYFIKAEGNYCLVVFNNKSTIEKQLIRSKLKEIEQIVIKSVQLIRCHKSYIINLNKVSNVTGNANGYILHSNEHDYNVPVSRKLSKSLINKIRSNENKK